MLWLHVAVNTRSCCLPLILNWVPTILLSLSQTFSDSFLLNHISWQSMVCYTCNKVFNNWSNGGLNETLYVVNRLLHHWNFPAHSNYNLRNKWFEEENRIAFLLSHMGLQDTSLLVYWPSLKHCKTPQLPEKFDIWRWRQFSAPGRQCSGILTHTNQEQTQLNWDFTLYHKGLTSIRWSRYTYFPRLLHTLKFLFMKVVDSCISSCS